MEPMSMMGLASLLGSVGSIGGSLFGANQQREDQQKQLYQAQLNYQLQKKIADDQLRMAQAGREDAAGNKVRFDGKNWTVDTTPETKGIIKASQLNEREQQVKGGFRREAGQSANFENRGQAGNLADAVLRQLQNGSGAPTLEGVRGRNTVAAATKVGANRDMLVDAVSRNLIRSGGSGAASDHALSNIDDGASRNLRVALADSDANAPEQFRQQREGYETGMMNKWNPLNAVRSNLTDAPFAPTQVGAPIDASLNQGAAYGAGTVGRNAGAINQGAGLIAGMNQTPMPWGSAFGALTDSVKAFMQSKNRAGANTDPSDPSFNRGF